MLSYYDVLGVSQTAEEHIIKAAYRALIKKHHPDVSLNSDNRKIQQINNAYACLSDPVRRKNYDTKLELMQLSKNPTTPPTSQVKNEKQEDPPLKFSDRVVVGVLKILFRLWACVKAILEWFLIRLLVLVTLGVICLVIGLISHIISLFIS